MERHATRSAPSFLYYLTPDQLTAEAGLALVLLAERTTTSRSRLLAEAIPALSGAVAALAAPEPASDTPAYPRSALLHATYLARACLLRGDLEHAVEAMRTSLSLLAHVQSPRGRSYLQALRSALAQRSRSLIVREFLDEFDEASSPV